MTGTRRTAVQQTAGIRLLFDALRGLLLVVLGLGYLVPALHFTLVQHEICAEHGELRHSDAPALSGRSVPSPGAALHAAPRVEHEHEHCAVLATSSVSSVSAGRSAPVLAPTAGVVVSQVSRADLAHPSLDLLLYAPKLAPPG